MYLPKGTFAPIPTPINSNGVFDADAQAQHMSWLQSEGLTGVLILGSNGEFPSFSVPERKAITEAASKAKGDLELLLNIGSCALPEVLVMLNHAAEFGFSAVLCPPPFYFSGSPQNGLINFFKRVLDASVLPVLLYHIPNLTGQPITDEILKEITSHENFGGIKDSTGNADEMARLLAQCKGRSYLVGNDKLIAKCYATGGQGSISAAASVVPDLVASVQEAPDQQVKLNSLRGMLEKFGLGGSVKAILKGKGFGEYGSRPPLMNLSAEEEAQLIAMLNMFGAIKWQEGKH